MIPIKTCVLVLLAGLAIASAQSQDLKIVVIKGEDAVNVIQQKTAVAPVIEVRDRNNLPVSGAAVTFTIGGGQGATFGGLSTLTVTTNAAGQAAAVGFTPTAAGAVQINAAAVFQGQTAIATITQTNVLTAAQAAGAAGGAAGGSGGATTGGAAAGGGGLSTTTLVVAGAAVAGGALVATQVVGGGGKSFSASFSIPVAVRFSFGCVRQETHSGTLVIELTSTTDPISGTAAVEKGTERIDVGCLNNAGPQAGATTPFETTPARVTGTTANFGYTHDDGNPALRSSTWTFTGSLSGDQITGTLALLTRIAGADQGAGSGSVSVTLR